MFKVCIYIYIYIYTQHVHVYVCVYVNVNVHVYVCVYIYIYTYTHTLVLHMSLCSSVVQPPTQKIVQNIRFMKKGIWYDLLLFFETRFMSNVVC